MSLHVHSEYSSLDGWSTVDEIAERMLEIKCPFCGLTDHGVVAGHVEFDRAMRSRGLNPVFGAELYHGVKFDDLKKNERDQAHLLALAMTDEGLRNLWRLTNATSDRAHFHHVGRVTNEDIVKFKEGIVFTSACPLGLVPQGLLKGDTTMLNWYLDNLGDNFRMEITTYPGDVEWRDSDSEESEDVVVTPRLINEIVVDAAQERGVKITYGDDGHYACNPGEAPIWMADLSFKALSEIREGDKIVGWEKGKRLGRRLCESEVLRVHKYRNADVVKVIFASGRVLRCTPNHLWRTMSYGGAAGSEYFSIPEVGRDLVHVIEPTEPLPDNNLRIKAAWLGGIFDGEGEAGQTGLGISQSEKNLPVVERIDQYLHELGFTIRKKNEIRMGGSQDPHGMTEMHRFFLAGGRSEIVRFTNWTNPAQRHKIAKACLTARWMTLDKIISVEPYGTDTVYGLTTTTGNYVAWGYASKNSPDQYEAHDMYIASQTRQSMYTPIEERKMWHPPGALCIKDEKTVRENLGYLPESVIDEAIANTYEIGESANAHLPDVGKPHMPIFVPGDSPWLDDPDEDVAMLFTRLVAEGIERIYGGTDREVEAAEKAIHEMEVLMEDHLEHYFLLAWDVIQFCKMEGINVGPGRGSSAGAIVAYALGITDVDPLHYDLYFERFWNKGRTDGFPDIDTDFAKSRRGEILDYLIDRIGDERVCSIGTITRMKPVAVIEKLAMACDIDHGEMEQIKNIVKQTKDIEIHGHEQIGWSPEHEPGKVIYVNTSTEMNPEGDKVGEEIDAWIGFDQHNNRARRAKFIEMCERACSRNSNYGIHASGIVVADIDLSDYAPAYRRGGKDGIPATQFPMSIVDERKLLKLDILGLKTLDTLAVWDQLMKKKGVETEWSGLDLQDHPEEMWDLLEEGFVSGVFQVETPSGKQLAEKLKPRSIEELAVLGSLNRPGPQRDGVPNRYIARMEGRSEVTYPHLMLEDILRPTYGLFVYQEQIIRFMGALGYSLGDADAVRKILGKKHPEKLSEIFEGFNEWDKKGFLTVAIEKGFTKESATEVWKGIEGFASYSFNKSHAVSYAIIGFRCLYAKYHGMQEFYIACIRTVDKQKRAELTPQYIKEARRAAIKVLPPDIRYSQAEVDVHDGRIYFGFGDVKGVGTSGGYLVTLRDEEGFDISTPEVFEEMLGCFNDMALARKKKALAEGDPFPAAWKSPKQLLNEKKLSLIHAAGAWDDIEDTAVDLRTKQKCELELLSVILTDNTEEILADHEEAIEQCSSWNQAAMSWEDKEADPDQANDWLYDDGEEVPMSKRYREYRLPGIITGVKPTKVRATGKAMGIITMEYGRHEISFACFSNKWSANKFLFKPHNVGIFTVRQSPPSDRRGEGYHFETGKLLT